MGGSLKENQLRERAISLVEVLTVTAIVIILVGILVPTLISAKSSAKRVTEISQLHQIGLAQALYSQETGHFGNLDAFVQLGLVPKALCISPLDTTPDGIANSLTSEFAVHSDVYAALKLNYPSTYVGFREYHYPDEWYDKYVLINPNPGWLVSWTQSKRVIKTAWHFTSGKYRRLLFDTSVVLRDFTSVHTSDGSTQHPLLQYSDPSDQWKEQFISTAP